MDERLVVNIREGFLTSTPYLTCLHSCTRESSKASDEYTTAVVTRQAPLIREKPKINILLIPKPTTGNYPFKFRYITLRSCITECRLSALCSKIKASALWYASFERIVAVNFA